MGTLKWATPAKPQRGSRSSATPPKKGEKRTDKVRVTFKGRGTPEQFTLAVQGVLANLQDMGVHSIQDCSMYIVPLRKNGQRMDLADEDGQILEDFIMELPEPSVDANSAGPMRLAFPGKTAAASGGN
jgi:hypothetical protein